MGEGNTLYDEFLGELAALDSFLTRRSEGRARTRAPGQDRARARPAGQAGAVGAGRAESNDEDAEEPEHLLPLSRHDPDVRRLLEGMAYLSARTRTLAVQGLRDAVDRMNRGYFDFLLAASPAAALVQVVPGTGLTKPAVLPRRTGLRVVTPEGAVGLFTTTRDLTIFPLAVGGVRRVPLMAGGNRLLLRIDRQGPIPEGAVIDPLSLRINDVDDYLRSRRLLALLAHSLRGISAIFDAREIGEDTLGIPCAHAFRSPSPSTMGETPKPPARPVTMGETPKPPARPVTMGETPKPPARPVTMGETPDPPARPSATAAQNPPPEDYLRTHPLARVRSFFHFPAQELFLDVSLPPPSRFPKGWKSVTLIFDVDENWPPTEVLNDDMFQLFEVPVENVRFDLAKPILCDGTKEAYLVEGQSPAVVAGVEQLPAEATELHSILGVYRNTPRGPVPIASALLSGHGDTWEVEEHGDDPDHLERRLLLDIAGAFDDPARIMVEGLWYQPGFDAAARSRLLVSLQRRRVEGLSFRLAGDLEPHRPSPLWNDPLKLLHLLSLRNNALLGKDEVVALLELLGVDRQSPHAAAVDLVVDVLAHEALATARGDGVAYVYEIVLRTYPPEMQGLVDDLKDQIFALLDAWLPGAVEVRVASRSGAKRLLPAGRTS